MLRKNTITKGRFASIFLAVSIAIMLISGILLLNIYINDTKEMRYWQNIARLKETAPEWSQNDILPKYQALYAENPDIVGWLTIDGTKIDYPVMQTKDTPEYYLRRNFNKEDDSIGTPFADYRCDIVPYRSFNTIIYGHLTSNGSMFRWLLNYAYKSWYEEHKEIHFDTLMEQGTYEVVAVFYADVTNATLMEQWDKNCEEAYTFYNYIEVDTEEGFSKFLEEIEHKKLYPTDKTCTLNAPIITLICCASPEFSGIEQNGRFVVIAQQIR